MRLLAFVAALLLAPGAIAPTFAGEGRDIVEGWKAWAESIRSEEISFRIGSVREEDGGRTTLAEDVTFSWRSGKPPVANPSAHESTPYINAVLKFPVVRLVDLRRVPDGVAAAAIAIPGATAHSEFYPGGDSGFGQVQDFVIGAITADEIVLPPFPEIADDPARPFSRLEPLFLAIAKVSSKRWEIASIAAKGTSPGARLTTTYGRFLAEGNRDGTTDRFSQDGMELSIEIVPEKNGDSLQKIPPPLKLTYRQTIARQYSFLPYLSLLFGANTADAATDLMIGELEQQGVIIDLGGGGIQLGRSVLSELRVASGQERLADAIDASLLGTSTDVSKEVADVALALRIYGAMSASTFVIDGIGLRAPEAWMSTGQIALRDMSSRGIGSIEVLDVSGGGQQPTGDASYTLQSFALRDLAFPEKDAILSLLRIAAAADSGGTPVAPDPRQMTKLSPSFGALELKNYSVSLPGPTSATIESLTLVLREPIGPVPTEVTAELVGLKLPSAIMTDPRGADFLAEAGIDTLHVAVRLAAKWNAATSMLSIDPMAVSVAGLGELDVGVTLSAVPRSVFEAPSMLPLAVPEMKVDEIRASFTNAPLLAGPLAAYATRQSLSVDAAIESIAHMAEKGVEPQTGVPFATAFANALESFLAGPTGTLQLSGRPAQPVPLVQVVGAATMAPGSLVKLLNAVVEYRQ